MYPAASCITQLCRVDQLISGREYEGIPKEGLTPSYQKASRHHGELITGRINSDAANTAAATSATSATSMMIDGDRLVTTAINHPQ